MLNIFNVQNSEIVQNITHKTEEGINVLVVKAKKVRFYLNQILNQDKTVHQAENYENFQRFNDTTQTTQNDSHSNLNETLKPNINTSGSNYEQIANKSNDEEKNKTQGAEKLDN